MANEKRLIDTNTFTWSMALNDNDEPFLYVTADYIEKQPTVDAVEVVHGRWIWREEDECWVCSNCELSALNNYRGNSTDSNYCPNCGAKMDGDKNGK